MLVLDINDVEIALTQDGEALYREPGVAFVGRDGAVFGRQALAQSRLHPRQSHNQFWQRLNADPVKPSGRGVENQADLVYRHLQAIRTAAGIRERAEVVVAAPATATQQQLAMLLGIAVEAGFDIRAIVDSAVAAACRQPLASQVVDVSLHWGIVAALDIADGDDGTAHARRAAVDEIPAAGFATLVEGWVDVVADRFVESTRFDPLRIAETEQQVFDQVVAGIDAGDAEFSIDVDHQDISRHVNVARSAFAEKSAQRYRLLAQAIGAPTTLAITHRVRKLPGLTAFLQAAGHELAPLADDAVAAAVAEHAERIVPADATAAMDKRRTKNASAKLISSLPIRSTADAGTATPVLPTHLLCGAVALPLGAEANASEHPAYAGGAPTFLVKRDQDGTTVVPTADATVALNGDRIDFEHPAVAGDVIACGGAEFQLIAVLAG